MCRKIRFDRESCKVLAFWVYLNKAYVGVLYIPQLHKHSRPRLIWTGGRYWRCEYATHTAAFCAIHNLERHQQLAFLLPVVTCILERFNQTITCKVKCWTEGVRVRNWWRGVTIWERERERVWERDREDDSCRSKISIMGYGLKQWNSLTNVYDDRMMIK